MCIQDAMDSQTYAPRSRDKGKVYRRRSGRTGSKRVTGKANGLVGGNTCDNVGGGWVFILRGKKTWVSCGKRRRGSWRSLRQRASFDQTRQDHLEIRSCEFFQGEMLLLQGLDFTTFGVGDASRTMDKQVTRAMACMDTSRRARVGAVENVARDMSVKMNSRGPCLRWYSCKPTFSMPLVKKSEGTARGTRTGFSSWRWDLDCGSVCGLGADYAVCGN